MSEAVESAPTDVKAEDVNVSRHDFAATSKAATPASPATTSTMPQAKPTTSALAAARFGSAARDSSPSLARDIASRRGIPQPGRNPPSAAAQARARQLSPESHRRSRSNVVPGSKIPPSIMDSQTLKPAQKARIAQQAESDDAFAKFYSNLTTGTMTKLSSVLAYAGLPLNVEDAKTEQATQQKLTHRMTVPASDQPDVKKMFSKAALEAIEDEHRQRGHHGHAFGPAESFYVVQTGGGTYSYADIAKQQQQLEGIDEDDEEAFVDAREAQSSPKHSRFSSRGGRDSFGTSRTQEELELENVTLKNTVEHLATRLSEFETHAQDASMVALTQSMASVPGQGPSGGADPALIARLRQVEQQLEQKTEETQKYHTLAMKQEKTLKKYQSKWEEIKQSAKEKQRAKAEKSEREVPPGIMEV